MYMTLLETQDIHTRLSQLSGNWELIGDELIRISYELGGFRDAVQFVNHVADLADKADHHPNIHIYYNTVILELATHSEGGLTEKDFDMAQQIEAL